MSKIIRLTESDLTRIVKQVIKEQSTATQAIVVSTPDEYGKAVFKALGPNFQIGAHDVDYRDNDKPGTYNGYFLQRYRSAIEYGETGIRITFDVKCYEVGSSKAKDGQLDITIIFSKGIPTSLDPCWFTTDKPKRLSQKDIMDKIFPKIKGITYNPSKTSKNGVEDSCLKTMGFKFEPKSQSRRAGPYGNLPASYTGNYKGNKTIFYLDGTLRVVGKNYQAKKGNWKCESGVLKVFNVTDWKLTPPS